jgi:hypothetical protein
MRKYMPPVPLSIFSENAKKRQNAVKRLKERCMESGITMTGKAVGPWSFEIKSKHFSSLGHFASNRTLTKY